jgi:serine phosphatase RsbU (regulator of sigma subunit)
MVRSYPAKMDAQYGDANVLRTGVSELHVDLPDEVLVAGAVDEEHLRLLRELGMRSGLAVPLPGRAGIIGVLTVIHAESGRRYGPEDVDYLEDVARRAALALETARVLRDQSGRLADVQRVADAAQQAILAAPPARLGPVALSARYTSAAAEALVGGDLYETVARDGAVRLIVGDVRGKGLAAVRTATIVLGEFRASAADLDDLAEVARQIDRRVRAYLGEEDFVTALLAEVRDDGTWSIACCGHPPALLASGGRLTSLQTDPSLPLGLGADPVLLSGRMVRGDRLLLYTDGVLEARDADREFVDLMRLVEPIVAGELETVLDDVLEHLHQQVGHDLGDDLALLVAEYRG